MDQLTNNKLIDVPACRREGPCVASCARSGAAYQCSHDQSAVSCTLASMSVEARSSKSSRHHRNGLATFTMPRGWGREFSGALGMLLDAARHAKSSYELARGDAPRISRMHRRVQTHRSIDRAEVAHM